MERDKAILGMHGREPVGGRCKVLVRPASAGAVVYGKARSSEFFGEPTLEGPWK